MGKGARAVKKILFAAGVSTAAVHGINRLTSAFAGLEEKRRKNRLQKNVREYEWTYGKVRYTKTGSGSPLLLLHDVSCSPGLSEWERAVKMLSRRYTVYTLEFLGFGLSDKPKITYSAYLLAGLVNSFIRDVIRPARGTLYAAASGGGAGILAAAHLLAPRYIGKMLLVSPTGAGTSVNTANGALRRFIELPIYGTAMFNILNSKFFLRRLLKNAVLDRAFVNRNVTGDYYVSAHSGGYGAKYAYAASVSNFLGVNIASLTAKVNIPVHIVWGSGNIINPIENFTYIQAQNPDISLTVFENARQYPHYENPNAFFKVCRWFFG